MATRWPSWRGRRSRPAKCTTRPRRSSSAPHMTQIFWNAVDEKSVGGSVVVQRYVTLLHHNAASRRRCSGGHRQFLWWTPAGRLLTCLLGQLGHRSCCTESLCSAFEVLVHMACVLLQMLRQEMFRSKWPVAAGYAASSQILLMIVQVYRTLMLERSLDARCAVHVAYRTVQLYYDLLVVLYWYR